MTEKTDNSPAAPATEQPTSDDRDRIHRRAIAIDMHADTAQRLLDEKVDLHQRLADGHFDAVRAGKADSTRSSFRSGSSRNCLAAAAQTAMKRADDQIAAVRALAEKHPETWELATTAADIRRIAAEGKLAALDGARRRLCDRRTLENVERYYKMGVRYMSPAWSVEHELGRFFG